MKRQKINITFNVLIMVLFFSFAIWYIGGVNRDSLSEFLKNFPYLTYYLEESSSLESKAFTKELLEKAKENKLSLLLNSEFIPVYIADYAELLGEGDYFRERTEIALIRPNSRILKNIENYDFYPDNRKLLFTEKYTPSFPMYLPNFECALHFALLEDKPCEYLYVISKDGDGIHEISKILNKYDVRYQIFENGLTKRNIMTTIALLFSNPFFVASLILLMFVLSEFLLVLLSSFNRIEREIMIHRIMGGNRRQVWLHFLKVRGKEVFFAMLVAAPFSLGIAILYSRFSISPVSFKFFYIALLFSWLSSFFWTVFVSLLYFISRLGSRGEKDVF